MTGKEGSDERLRAAMLRTAEATRTLEGDDVAAIAAEACDNFWRARPLVLRLQRGLVEEAHRDDGWRERRAAKRATSDEKGFQNHFGTCEKCQALLAPVTQYVTDLVQSRRI
jgi:hypothetical protein